MAWLPWRLQAGLILHPRLPKAIKPYKFPRVIAQELRQEQVDGSIAAPDGTMRQYQPIIVCLQHAILSLAPLGFK
jgi:hypothetical protein